MNVKLDEMELVNKKAFETWKPYSRKKVEEALHFWDDDEDMTLRIKRALETDDPFGNLLLDADDPVCCFFLERDSEIVVFNLDCGELHFFDGNEWHDCCRANDYPRKVNDIMDVCGQEETTSLRSMN